jgi:hypothetical protein
MYCEGDLILLYETEVSVWLEECIHLTLGLLQTEHLTNGDEGKHTQNLYAFSANFDGDKGLHPPAVKVKAVLVSND